MQEKYLEVNTNVDTHRSRNKLEFASTIKANFSFTRSNRSNNENNNNNERK